jgi:hypothetical protein
MPGLAVIKNRDPHVHGLPWLEGDVVRAAGREVALHLQCPVATGPLGLSAQVRAVTSEALRLAALLDVCVWTAPAGQEVFGGGDDLIGSSHVSGLLVRCP